MPCVPKMRCKTRSLIMTEYDPTSCTPSNEHTRFETDIQRHALKHISPLIRFHLF
jgi:hypothetical protein